MGALDWNTIMQALMGGGVLAHGLAAMRWAVNMENRVTALEKKGGPL